MGICCKVVCRVCAFCLLALDDALQRATSGGDFVAGSLPGDGGIGEARVSSTEATAARPQRATASPYARRGRGLSLTVFGMLRSSIRFPLWLSTGIATVVLDEAGVPAAKVAAKAATPRPLQGLRQEARRRRHHEPLPQARR